MAARNNCGESPADSNECLATQPIKSKSNQGIIVVRDTYIIDSISLTLPSPYGLPDKTW